MIITYLLLTGPPGAGKGTQSGLLCKKYGLHHLSTGDLFRQHMQKGSPLGQNVKKLVENGQLVPDNVVHEMVVNTLEGLTNHVLLDGYPRTLQQAHALEAYLALPTKHIQTIVLQLHVDQNTLKQRLRLRGQSSGRSDDANDNKINHRLHVYEEETQPMMAYYHKRGQLKVIPAEGTVEAVFAALCKAVDGAFD